MKTINKKKRALRHDGEDCVGISPVEPDATPPKRRKVSDSSSSLSAASGKTNKKRKRTVEPHEEETLRL